MNYHGRQIDPLAFWNRYVTFPDAMRIEDNDEFSPKVICPNPAHDTLKSHFQINLTQPTVHCFARCGISGSYEHAVCVIEGLFEKFDVAGAPNDRERKRRYARAFRQARKIILQQATTGPKSSRKPRVRKSSGNSRTAKLVSFESLLYESFLPPVALEYLEARGISSASVSTWQLGWLPAERRLVIPARDENGHLKFLIKRSVLEKDRPKYLYTEGYPKTHLLFGACQIDLGLVSSQGLILVEGSLDTILFHQFGLRNTVGILGTGISEEQRRIIARINPPKVIHFFDKDSAGIVNIGIASKALRKYPQYVALYPKGKADPGELTEKEAHRQISRVVTLRQFHQRLNVTRKERKISVG
jgi:DNA primase